MTPPTTWRRFSKFIDLVNYYYETWERSLNRFQPLTNIMSSTMKFKWIDI